MRPSMGGSCRAAAFDRLRVSSTLISCGTGSRDGPQRRRGRSVCSWGAGVRGVGVIEGGGWAYRNPYEQLAGTGAQMSRRVRSAGFVERRFDADGVGINYVVGPEHGLPLVLLPAQMGTWETYEPVLVQLSRSFQVWAVDLRGHGRSTWTPGDYSWSSFGADMTAFLDEVVARPAIVSGNSSGGLVALWCAANLPDRVRAAVLEDAPVFSAELPRFRDRDRYVHRGLEHAVAALGDLQHRDLADYLRGQELPVSESRARRVPEWFLGPPADLARRAAARVVVAADGAAAVRLPGDVRPGRRASLSRRSRLRGTRPRRGPEPGALLDAGATRGLAPLRRARTGRRHGR